jgi:ornithine carbamoyltransferase
MKHFLSISSCSPEELRELLKLSIDLKKVYKSGGRDLCCSGKTLAMLFEKPSLRTRVSFEVAIIQLGGSGIYIKPEDIGGIGKREPIKDMARVFSRYVDAIMARVFEHEKVTELAKWSSVPMINALTDWSHPCQAMADIMTLQEYFGDLKGRKIAFIGDGNNVARSLAFACAKLGMKFVCASPAGYELDKESIDMANSFGPNSVEQLRDPRQAVKNASILLIPTIIYGILRIKDSDKHRIIHRFFIALTYLVFILHLFH